jgi:hypothetical protein
MFISCGSDLNVDKKFVNKNGQVVSRLKLLKTIIHDEVDHFIKYIYNKNYIYAVSYYNVCKFNLDGKLVKKIGRKGEGPGEFIYITDAVISNNKIIVADSNFKIVTFSLNGKILKSKTYKLSLNFLQRIFKINDRLLCMKERLIKIPHSFVRKLDLYDINSGKNLLTFNNEKYVNAIHFSGKIMKGPWFIAPFHNRVVPILDSKGDLYVFSTRKKEFYKLSKLKFEKHFIKYNFKEEPILEKDKETFFKQMERANNKKINKKMKDSIPFDKNKEFFTGIINWNDNFALIKTDHFLIIDINGNFIAKVFYPSDINLDTHTKLKFAENKIIVVNDTVYYFDTENKCMKVFKFSQKR